MEPCQPCPRPPLLRAGNKPEFMCHAVTRPLLLPASTQVPVLPPDSPALGHAEVVACWGLGPNSPGCFILLARPPPPDSTQDSRSLPEAPSLAAPVRPSATTYQTSSVWGSKLNFVLNSRCQMKASKAPRFHDRLFHNRHLFSWFMPKRVPIKRLAASGSQIRGLW